MRVWQPSIEQSRAWDAYMQACEAALSAPEYEAELLERVEQTYAAWQECRRVAQGLPASEEEE